MTYVTDTYDTNCITKVREKSMIENGGTVDVREEPLKC